MTSASTRAVTFDLTQMVTWQTLLTLSRKSDDFTHLAKQLLSHQRYRKFDASSFPEDEALKLIELMEPAVGLTMCSEIYVVPAKSIHYRSFSMRTSLVISKVPRLKCFESYVVHSGGCQGHA